MKLSDYEIIKKHYGELFAKFCRANFPTILETPGKLSNILLSTFYPNHYLYQDLLDNDYLDSFKKYIYSLLKREIEEINTNKSVKELLSLAGYNFYECQTEYDIQQFKKYYAKDEVLCTFNGNRLQSWYVFFAVKKDVDNIRREDFKNPERQDLYGTSVISIQFTRKKPNYLSIKNRYNHTVTNPDSTFSNNLDNIIPGLSAAFREYYKLDINYSFNKQLDIPDYIQDTNGKFYRYNIEMNNIYYCPNNIIIKNGKVIKYDTSRYLLIDYFLIDLKEKRIECLIQRYYDSFIETNGVIDKIEIKKINNNKRITIYNKKNEIIEITINKYNSIIEYKNNYVEIIKDDFLPFCENIESFIGENVKRIGDSFLEWSTNLNNIHIPNVKKIGDYFLRNNTTLTSLDLEHLEEVGDQFLPYAENLKTIKLYNLKKAGDYFLDYCNARTIYFPLLKSVGNRFMASNITLEQMNLPSIEIIGNSFLMSNEMIKDINLRNVEEIGDDFLFSNQIAHNVIMPKLKKVGRNFLYANNTLELLKLYNLKQTGNNFLFSNKVLKELYLPSLEEVGTNFLSNNTTLEELSLPNLKIVDNAFLFNNNSLKILIAPNIEYIADYFLFNNRILNTIDINNVKNIGDCFLFFNTYLTNINLPNLESHGINFLKSNDILSLQKKVLS